MNPNETTGQPGPTEAISVKLAGLMGEMRTAIGQADDIQVKAMLETGAEVLGGLRQAFVDYATGTEEAWRH